jgi:hypothetical protein
MDSLLQLLLYLLIAGVVLYCVQLVLGLIAIPAQIKTLILIIVGVVLLVFMLRALGMFVF